MGPIGATKILGQVANNTGKASLPGLGSLPDLGSLLNPVSSLTGPIGGIASMFNTPGSSDKSNAETTAGGNYAPVIYNSKDKDSWIYGIAAIAVVLVIFLLKTEDPPKKRKKKKRRK
mgnify:CR=1 FL=1